MADEAIGMMDKAYFVGKVAIIEWVNELLQVRSLPESSISVLASCFQDRGVCNRRCLLRNHG
jgi:hypothetical protein